MTVPAAREPPVAQAKTPSLCECAGLARGYWFYGTLSGRMP